MLEKLKDFSDFILPDNTQLPIRFFYKFLLGRLDDEMKIVNKLLDKKRRFLDVGANIGIYSYYFRNKFHNVEAFEPIKEITYRLESLKSKSIKVHHVALSNKTDEVKLFIPLQANGKMDAGLSSLEEKSKCLERIVDAKTIDSYQFNDIDLIKIDVEGHEESVLVGALKTINKCKPIIIVEIEQRHIKKNILEVFDLFISFNYDGFFLIDYSLVFKRF